MHASCAVRVPVQCRARYNRNPLDTRKKRAHRTIEVFDKPKQLLLMSSVSQVSFRYAQVNDVKVNRRFIH